MKRKIGFIGAGNMGSAIMKGAAASSLSKDIEIYAADMDVSKVDELADIGVKKCNDAVEVTDKCDIVFLAVKPQGFENALDSIKGHVRNGQIFVSIAAGITAEYIKKALGNDNISVILAMPNTPLLLGEGATAIGENASVDKEQFDFICDIFANCGMVRVIPEDKMKEIIAVNGSSPAFIYLFSKCFVEYAKSVGIEDETATALFCQSLIGSAKMMTDSGYTIDELIKMVSSPGGTTLAGLDRLYANDMQKAVDEACIACTKRAYELSK